MTVCCRYRQEMLPKMSYIFISRLLKSPTMTFQCISCIYHTTLILPSRSLDATYSSSKRCGLLVAAGRYSAAAA